MTVSRNIGVENFAFVTPRVSTPSSSATSTSNNGVFTPISSVGSRVISTNPLNQPLRQHPRQPGRLTRKMALSGLETVALKNFLTHAAVGFLAARAASNAGLLTANKTNHPAGYLAGEAASTLIGAATLMQLIPDTQLLMASQDQWNQFLYDDMIEARMEKNAQTPDQLNQMHSITQPESAVNQGIKDFLTSQESQPLN